jgi:SAM-dependent methyltransferase
MDIFIYFFKVFKKRGFRFIWDYFSESLWFDIRNQTSTAARVTKDEQTIESNLTEQNNGLLYVASFTSVTKKTLAIARDILGPKLMRTAQFMDLGCGKGKALLVYAREYGELADYAAVGIEYDPVLAEQARINVRKVAFASGRVEIITGSATNLRAFLKSQISVIYLYNSFQGETLRATLSAMQGLPHVLIYVDPIESERLTDFRYTIVAEHVGRYNADTWLVAVSVDFDKKLYEV